MNEGLINSIIFHLGELNVLRRNRKEVEKHVSVRFCMLFKMETEIEYELVWNLGGKIDVYYIANDRDYYLGTMNMTIYKNNIKACAIAILGLIYAHAMTKGA